MKKFLLSILVAATCFQSCKQNEVNDLKLERRLSALTSSGWAQLGSFPGARIGAFGFSVGNKGYLGAGAAPNGIRFDLVEYNPETNKWTRKADFPGGERVDAVTFTIGNKGYVGSGIGFGNSVVNNNGFQNDLWEYLPTTNTWTRKADLPVTQYQAASSAAFSIGNKGYIGIFCGDFKLFEYDPTQDKWTQKASVALGNRRHVIAFSIGNKGYVGLGIKHSNKDGSDSFINDIWEYNPDTDTWVRKADFPGGGRSGAVAFTIKDKGYVSTGSLSNNELKNDLWEFDPLNNTWELQNISGIPGRTRAAGFSIGNSGYLGTGFNMIGNHYQSDFWKFTVAE